MQQTDPNFLVEREVFCSILEQAVDDWRALRRAGRIPAYAVGVTYETILRGRNRACGMSRDEIIALLRLLTTTELDRYCSHLNDVINPDGVRRALGIPRPKLLDYVRI